MPLYEYECQDCHYRFERLQRFSDPPPPKCPECGGKIAQLMSAAAIQFKGSGWYVTDYGRKAPAQGQEGKKQAETKTEAKTEAKPESKTESKTESKSAGSSSGKEKK